MKYIIFICALFVMSGTKDLNEDTWNEIHNKTWFSMGISPMGTDLVFLQDRIGKKAVIENLGSGCCRIFSMILEVQITGDTLVLFPLDETNGLFLTEKKKYTRFILKRHSKTLFDIDHNNSYFILSDKPILHKGCCTKLDIRQLGSDTIKYPDFNYPSIVKSTNGDTDKK